MKLPLSITQPAFRNAQIVDANGCEINSFGTNRLSCTLKEIVRRVNKHNELIRLLERSEEIIDSALAKGPEKDILVKLKTDINPQQGNEMINFHGEKYIYKSLTLGDLKAMDLPDEYVICFSGPNNQDDYLTELHHLVEGEIIFENYSQVNQNLTVTQQLREHIDAVKERKVMINYPLTVEKKRGGLYFVDANGVYLVKSGVKKYESYFREIASRANMHNELLALL